MVVEVGVMAKSGRDSNAVSQRTRSRRGCVSVLKTCRLRP